MAGLATLRKQAKDAGIPASEIRSADSAAELQKIIDAHAGGNGNSGTKKARKAVKKAVKAVKKSGGNSTKKSSARKTASAAKSTKGKASRASSAPANGDLKRHLLDDVDFTLTEGWNPREGSAPDRIIKALRKHKGDRDKAFNTLLPDLWDFVGKRFANGEKRPKADAEWMLNYRISRTAWDFALKTGQHEKAKGRADYGTAGTGAGLFKRKKASGSAPAKAKKSSAKKKKATKKRK